MGGRFAFVVALGLGCGGPAQEPVQSPTAPPTAEVKVEPTTPSGEAKVETRTAVAEFEAVVRVDERPGGKKFQGVWLERADGERWVAAYRPLGWLRVFDGFKVRVTGGTYEPFGQAIRATHFHVDTIKISMRAEVSLLEVGPETAMTGTFVQVRGEAGSKSAGETWWTFVAADGKTYEIEGVTEGTIAAGAARVVARVAVPDWSYRARRGGEYLWLVKVEAA